MRSRTIPLGLATIAVAVGLTVAGLLILRLVPEPGGDTVAELLARLEGGTGSARREAASALGPAVGPGAAEATRALIGAARSKDPALRARAARSLGTILSHNHDVPRHDDGVATLASALADPDPGVRASAAAGLRELGLEPPGAFEATLDGVRGDDLALRAESEASLSARPIRGADDLRSRLALLDDPSTAVRRAARSSLARPGPTLDPPSCLPALATTLRLGPAEARALASSILGRALPRGPAARDLLGAALRDRDATVRAEAASALVGYSEDRLARLSLRAAGGDPDPRVRAAAAASLAAGREVCRAEALAELEEALGPDRARDDLPPLLASGPDHAAAGLAAALGNPDPRVRAACARCLGELADQLDRSLLPRLAEILARSLDDGHPSVRRASACALARLGPDATHAADALRYALRDKDTGVATAARLGLNAIDRTSMER